MLHTLAMLHMYILFYKLLNFLGYAGHMAKLSII